MPTLSAPTTHTQDGRLAQYEDRRVCLKVAGGIVSSAIQSGNLSLDADEVCAYFAKIHAQVVSSLSSN